MTAPNPEGDVVLVPREPTEAMMEAGRSATHAYGRSYVADCYRAMIEAAPAALQPSPAPCFECGSTERTGTACKPCNPQITNPNFGSPSAPSDQLREFAQYVSGMMQNLPRSATADAVNERAQAILAALPPVSGGGLGLSSVDEIERILRDKIHRTSRVYSVRTGEKKYGVGGFRAAAEALYARQQAAPGRERGE